MGYDWGKQLFSSSHRLELLQQLRSEPADTQALTERLSISRVTVQRHLNQCCELGWVRKVEGRYELTPVGDHVCAATTTFLDRLEVLEEHEAVIDGLGAIDDSFDPLMLADATVSVADANNPHEPIMHYRNAIAAATPTSVRGILPVFSELLIEVHRELLDEGVDTELIAPRSVLEAAPPPIDELPSEIFTVYVLDRSLEFGVTLIDDAAIVGIYDEGTFVACIESGEPAFREWVADVYETYLERARRVPLEATGGTTTTDRGRESTADGADFDADGGSRAEPEPESDSEPEPESRSEFESESESDSASDPESEPDLETELEPDYDGYRSH